MKERQFPLGSGFLYGLYQNRLRRFLTTQPLPRHVAMIIDGNRRWARLRELETAAHGHRAGAAKYREFLEWCDDLGISVATLYLLSTDNLTGRTQVELEGLFEIIGDLAEDLSHFRDWRVQHVGSTDGLPAALTARLSEAALRTKDNTGLHVNLAIGYGGRREIADAMRSIVQSHESDGGTLDALAELLTPELIGEHLYTGGQPDPDLVIRTSGEQRISDFMLWQSAHSEFYFVEALGPDLREVDFLRALRDFSPPPKEVRAVTTIDEFLEGFSEEPGYLDFAHRAPIGRTARDEESALSSLIARSRFGTLDTLAEQDARVRAAVAELTGFRESQVAFQPNTSQGLMHAMFGITGQIALSPAEFPSNTFAVTRAADALGVVTPLWLNTDHGRVTPGNLREQLTKSTVAVAVSLVDFRTGYLVDLEGIRQVIGDRLLIVDAIQGFGIVDAPFELADVVVSGGQKWVRAGWGTGFLAMSDRAVDRLTPVFSGFNATDAEGTPLDEVPPPTRGAAAFQISNPDPVAQARFAGALEEIAEVGVPVINELLAEKTSRIIDLADEFAIEVVSSRDETERAGIVVIEPEADQLTLLTASLHNHGVTVTTRQGQVRLSPHISTDEETFAMLRAALISFASAI